MADDVKLTFRFEDASQAAPQAPGSPTAPGTGQGRTTPGQSHAAARGAAQAAAGAQGSLAAGHAAKTATGGGASGSTVTQPPRGYSSTIAPPTVAGGNYGSTYRPSKAANQLQAPQQPILPQGSATQPMPANQAAPNQGQPPQGQPTGPRQRWRGAPPPARRQPTIPAPKWPTASKPPVSAAATVAQSAIQAAKEAQLGAAQIVGGAKTGNPLLIGHGVTSMFRAVGGMGEKISTARESASDLAEKAREAAKVAQKAEARAERLRNAVPKMKAAAASKPQVAAAVGRAAVATNQAVRAGAAAQQAAGAASVAARGASAAGLAGTAGAVTAGVAAPFLLAAGAYGAARYAAGSRRDQIEHVSGEILTAKAMAEVRQIMADLKSNQKLGKGLAKMTDLESQIGSVMQRGGDVLLKPIIEMINKILEVVLRLAEPIVDFLEANAGNIEAVAKFWFEHMSPFGEAITLLLWWLGKQKQKENDNTWGIIDWFERQSLPIDDMPGSDAGFRAFGKQIRGGGRDIAGNAIKLGLGVP